MQSFFNQKTEAGGKKHDEMDKQDSAANKR